MKDTVELTVRIDAGSGAGDRETDALTRRFLAEIEKLDVDSVIPVNEDAPAGAKAGALTAIGVLFVKLPKTLAPKLIKLLKHLLTIHDAGTVEIEIPDVKVKFPADMSPEKLDQFMAVLTKQTT